MQPNREHNKHVPDRVRPASTPVEPPAQARREHALGEVRRVEGEPDDVRRERGHDGRDEAVHRRRGVQPGEMDERGDAAEREREEERDARVL